MMNLSEKVYNFVKKVPKGKVATYKAVAVAIGQPQAGRAVAMALSKNFDPKIPCHRVVCSDGTLAGYNRGGSKSKRELLIKEGIKIENNRIDLKMFSCFNI